MDVDERDIARSILLQQKIMQGDQADPKAGFSYLDNIANILAGNNVSGEVLLDQLTGAGDKSYSFSPYRDPDFTRRAYNIPLHGPIRVLPPPGVASDIPDQMKQQDRSRIDQLDLPTAGKERLPATGGRT